MLNYYREYIFLFIVLIALMAISSCRIPNIGGAGWDETEDVEAAKRYPTIQSDRISLTTEEVPFGTFKQEFNNVFSNFPFSLTPVEKSKTQIKGTFYSVSYENFVLRIFRDDTLITERTLPRVFYMHPISSGAIIEKSISDDLILCRTLSRATTGLHYVLIIDGKGEILFEKIMSAGDDWDILLDENKSIVIGGARTKSTISQRR